MFAQAPPLESQRLHWYAYDVGLPLHEPFEPVRTRETCAVPLISGSAVLEGGLDAGGGGGGGASGGGGGGGGGGDAGGGGGGVGAAATTAVGLDVAAAEPFLFFAVTSSRSVVPTSPAPSV